MANKNPNNLTKSLTVEEFNSLKACMENVYEFAKHIYLIHPIRGKVHFDLYPFQKKVLWYFLTERFNIILKFRQAGMTELISMFALWMAMYQPNKNVMIISIKERVAKKVLRKIKYMYKNLPDYLKVPIVNGRTGDIGTASEMEFSNGSLISSLPTTEDAGRSEGLSLLVVDEAAIIKWANQIWASAWPTLSTGGASIVNSTPYGVGNWFHKLWVDACAGGNTFHAIRLRWQMHPERDMAWYELQRQILGPRRTAQEIDGDFLTSGNSVFDLMDIRAIEEALDDDKPIRIEENGSLLVYDDPIKDHHYYIGADVSTGRARDYSTFSIMDRHGKDHAVYKGKIPVDRFADLLMKMGKKYNLAVIGPETNDIGLAVTMKIQEQGYRHLYYSTQLVKEKGVKKPKEEKIPGWLTTKKNRPIIIDNLEEDIRTGDIEVRDPFFVQEAYTFIYDDRNKPIAMGKDKKLDDGEEEGEVYTDDSILGKAITNHIRKGKLKSMVILPV